MYVEELSIPGFQYIRSTFADLGPCPLCLPSLQLTAATLRRAKLLPSRDLARMAALRLAVRSASSWAASRPMRQVVQALGRRPLVPMMP